MVTAIMNETEREKTPFISMPLRDTETAPLGLH